MQSERQIVRRVRDACMARDIARSAETPFASVFETTPQRGYAALVQDLRCAVPAEWISATGGSGG